MQRDTTPTDGDDVSRRAILRRGATDQTADGEGWFRATRRGLLGGVTALAAGSVYTGTVLSSSHRDAEEIPLPDVEGPITGGSRTGGPKESDPRDVSEWGYVEEEYFLSGEAMALGPAGLQADTEDDRGAVAEYTTRMIVWRPADMSGSTPGRAPGDAPGQGPPSEGGFSGTVHVNWPNQTLQEDNPVTIINTLEYLAEQGHVGILLSAQKQGVDGSPLGCRWWDPVRYGDLSHPGDEYGYDILSQCTKLLKEGPGDGDAVDPLQGQRADRVYASGVSQSASMLTNYVNEVHELHEIVDGFMPFNVSASTEIADDVAPVLWINSEDEYAASRADGEQFVLWEIAGASHVNAYTSYWRSLVRNRDQGTVGGEGSEAEWDDVEAGQYGERGSGVCVTDGNYFPYRYALRAGVSHLDEWVRNGDRPPSAPRFELDDNGEPAEDDHGNIRGGLRLPPIDVPVADYQARACEEYDTLFGQTIQFRTSTLEELYPTHDDYVAELQDAVDDAIEAGYLLERDAAELMERARRSDVPEGELP